MVGLVTSRGLATATYISTNRRKTVAPGTWENKQLRADPKRARYGCSHMCSNPQGNVELATVLIREMIEAHCDATGIIPTLVDCSLGLTGLELRSELGLEILQSVWQPFCRIGSPEG